MRFNQAEFILDKPEIFSGVNVSYGETRRDPSVDSAEMSGNTTVSREVIERARLRFAPESDPNEFYDLRSKEAYHRRGHLQRLLGFRAGIALSRPEHGTTLIDTDAFKEAIITALGPTEPDERQAADAVFTRTPNRATLFNPADCAIVNFANIKNGVQATGQIHAGAAGLFDDIIGKSFWKLEKDYGLYPENMTVYVSPTSDTHTIYGGHLERAQSAGLQQYLKLTEGQRYLFDMRRAALDQLEAAGVSSKNIQASMQDSSRSDTMYSQRRSVEDDRSQIGRNAVIFGKVDPRG